MVSIDLVREIGNTLIEPAEDADYLNWEKSTVKFAVENQKKVKRLIGNILRKRNMPNDAVEEIFSDLIEVLYSASDYKENIESKNGGIVTMEGYINSYAKNCTKKYMTEYYNKEKNRVNNYIDSSGKEVAIYDLVEDEGCINEVNKAVANLREYANDLEYKRYEFGPDVFQVIYIGLRVEEDPKSLSKILKALNVDSSKIKQSLKSDKDLLQFVRAIGMLDSDREKVISVVGEKVYCKKYIDSIIDSIDLCK